MVNIEQYPAGLKFTNLDDDKLQMLLRETEPLNKAVIILKPEFTEYNAITPKSYRGLLEGILNSVPVDVQAYRRFQLTHDDVKEFYAGIFKRKPIYDPQMAYTFRDGLVDYMSSGQSSAYFITSPGADSVSNIIKNTFRKRVGNPNYNELDRIRNILHIPDKDEFEQVTKLILHRKI